MASKWLPDLPFNDYYQFLASVGVLMMGLALIIEPEYLSGRLIFEMGAAAVIVGIFGWLVEKAVGDYANNANIKWQHAVTKGGRQHKSPYEIYDRDPTLLAALVGLSRFALFFILVGVEWYLYIG